VGALFAIYFAGMGSEGMVECLAVDVLRVVGQMIAYRRRQVAVDAVRHGENEVSAPAGMMRPQASANWRSPALR